MCNISTLEKEAGRSERSSRSSLATYGIGAQPGLKTLSPKTLVYKSFQDQVFNNLKPGFGIRVKMGSA